MTTARAYAVVTGGGTGGHVYPAIAIADELVRRGHPRESIHFVGASRGMEARTVPAHGYTIDLLPGRGLQRRLTPRALVDNVGALWGTLRALVQAWRVLGRRRPDVVVSVGGFASVPCVLAAWPRRIPVVVHEQNAAPGLANRLAVRLGGRAAVSLPGTPLPGAVLTGNPIRAEIAAVVHRHEAADAPRRALVGAFGGSLGARRVNDAVLDLADRWRRHDDRIIHHVAGTRDHERCARVLASTRRAEDSLVYDLVAYEEHMERLYARADVAVCRAGAVTVAELAAAGVAAVLVPLPGAPGDHQTRNADALVTAGAAVTIPDAQLDGPRLAATLDELLAEPARLATMRVAARALARPDAAARFVDLVEEVARERA